MKPSILVIVISASACTTSIDGDELTLAGDGSARDGSGATTGSGSGSGSSSGAADTAPSNPDGTSPEDDLSRCAPDSIIIQHRDQLRDKAGSGYDDTWATPENYPVSQFKPAFGLFETFKNNVVAVKIRVPLDYQHGSSSENYGFIRVAETPGAPVTGHALCIADSACDFSNCPLDGNTAPGGSFKVGGTTEPYTPSFQPGQVFWVNVAHRSWDGTMSCPDNVTSCGVFVDIASPHRY